MTSPDPLLERLVEVADELYAAEPGVFTTTRGALAARVDDRALATRVKALRKPSTAAWAVNLLVRREADQIDQVLALGASLREAAAAMDGDELRALTRQRRQLTHALTTTARTLAREHGVRITGPVGDQVEAVLNAALLDPVAADAVRTGLLLTAFSSTGVSTLDPVAVLAVPDALGTRAGAVEIAESEQDGRPALRVVPEDDTVRRERARDALAAAEDTLADAEETATDASNTVEAAHARRLQVHDEIDGLRRRLADLEDEAEAAEDELDTARTVDEEAQEALAAARRERDAARRALDSLER